MELGYSVYIIDKDGCKTIRKGVITRVAKYTAFADYLSSRPHEKIEGVEYTVCAVKKGNYTFFRTSTIFENLSDLKAHLAEEAFKDFDVTE